MALEDAFETDDERREALEGVLDGLVEDQGAYQKDCGTSKLEVTSCLDATLQTKKASLHELVKAIIERSKEVKASEAEAAAAAEEERKVIQAEKGVLSY